MRLFERKKRAERGVPAYGRAERGVPTYGSGG